MARKTEHVSDDVALNWLRHVSVENFKVTLPEKTLETLRHDELVALSENMSVIAYIAYEMLPQAEDDQLREGRRERLETPIYALIGRHGQRNVNDIHDLEGTPVRTRKGEKKGRFKATEEFELLGVLSEYLSDDTGLVKLVTVVNEIVDVVWNLVKLERLGINHGLDEYVVDFAHRLGFTYAQLLTLMVAKYHGRSYKGGKNLEQENEYVSKLLEVFGEPTKDQLDSFSKIADHLLGKELVAIRDTIEAQFEGEKLRRAAGIMGQALASEVSEE